MALREQDKHFLWALYMAVAVIFTWKGVWSGIYEIPVYGDPFIFLFFGFAILTLSGMVFREFDPLGGVEKGVNKVIQFVKAHPQKQEFSIVYRDKAQKKNVPVSAEKLRDIESGTLIIQGDKEELFIPIHRVIEIRHQGKRYWRL